MWFGSLDRYKGTLSSYAYVLLVLYFLQTREPPVLPVLQQQVGWMPQAQSFLVPVIDAIRWGLSNLVWVVLIGFGVWVWSGGVKTMTARLKAHRFGFNLFR